MMFFFLLILAGAGCIAYGVYQKKTYFDHPHYQTVSVVGYEKYQSNARGLQGLAFDTISSAAGMKNPAVDITLDNGAIKTVKLNTVVSDPIITKYPEFDIGGQVDVQFFGNDPKIAYLTNHPMAQRVVKTSAAMLIGIALLALAALLIGASIYFANTL